MDKGSKPFDFLITEDLLGKKIIFSIDTNLFDINVIYKTAYWFTEKFYIFFKKQEDLIIVEARAKDEFKEIKLEQIAGEFSNSLLDFKLREKIFIETRSIRDSLVAKAFSEGAKTKDIEGINSNEKAIPKNFENFLNKKNNE